MTKSIYIRIMAIVISFVMIFPIIGTRVSAVTEDDVFFASDGYVKTASNNNLSLYLNEKTTNFYIEDNNSSMRVYAFPEQTEDDGVANAAYKIEMQSALLFTIWDLDKKSQSVKNSNATSVMQNSYKIRRQDNGFYIDYDLKAYSISVTLSVTLTNDGLECTLPAKSIKENNRERYQLLEIAVMPFMISGRVGDNGNIVLPDGCGELVDFATDNSAADVYKKEIYGRNLTAGYSIETKTGYDINCPYLALIRNDIGVLSIPKNGAAIGFVNANPAGRLSMYANAYFSFKYRDSDLAIIGDITAPTSQSTRIISKYACSDDITVSFSFIFGDVKLSSLANLYGDYLVPSSMTKSNKKYSIIFDVYGFVNVKKSFLGFPYTSLGILSEGDDIVSLAADEQYRDVAINLKNVTNQQKKNTIDTSMLPISKVLSKKQLTKLKNEEADVFVSADPLTFKKNSFTENRFFSASKTIYGMPVGIYSFNESTHLPNKDSGKTYLLKHTKLENVMKKLLSSAVKTGFKGLYSDTLGAISYHDYSLGGTLTDTHNAQLKAIKSVASEIELILSNPFDYAYAYCTAVTDIPTDCSNNDLGSGPYPFIQMALGGRISYFTESVNLSVSPSKTVKRAMLTGSNLKYELALSNPDLTIGTDLNYLYSANYDELKELIGQQYATVTDAKNKTEDSTLVDYFETDSTATAVFENGAVITVNFNE